jgi:hypothetical protein
MSALHLIRIALPIYAGLSGSYGLYRGYTFNERRRNTIKKKVYNNFTNAITTALVSIIILPIQIPTIIRRYIHNSSSKDDTDLL